MGRGGGSGSRAPARGLAGSSSIIGIAGYSIGGGVGWLARLYGLVATAFSPPMW